MWQRVNLVVMLMAVICAVRALQARPRFVAYDDHSEADKRDEAKIPPRGLVTTTDANSIDNNPEQRRISTIHRSFIDDANDAFEDTKSAIQSVHTYVKQAVEPRRRHRQDKHMMSLLLAYKMKLLILVPIMIGGLILLTSTTALAGFFFALFAAVLGLQGK